MRIWTWRDYGNAVCTPFVSLIPRSCSPLVLIVVHFLVIVVLVNLVILHKLLPSLWHVPVLALCVVLSLLAIMFDHIIGLFVAKYHNTDVRSTFLRRWLDLLQTPLLLSSVLAVIGTEPWIAGAALSVCGLVCLADTLLAYHLRSHHLDIISLPLRARIFCTGIYASACVFNLWPQGYPLIPHLFPKVVGMVVLYVACNSFLRALRFLNQLKHWLPLLELAGLLSALGYMYQDGFFSYASYLLTITFLIHRVAGAYLLHAHLGVKYRGRDRAVYAWLAAFAWFSFVCHPIPLNFLCNKLSFCQTRNVGAFSVQSILPIIFCCNMMRRSVKECYQKLNLSEEVFPGRNHIFKAVGADHIENESDAQSVLTRRLSREEARRTNISGLSAGHVYTIPPEALR